MVLEISCAHTERYYEPVGDGVVWHTDSCNLEATLVIIWGGELLSPTTSQHDRTERGWFGVCEHHVNEELEAVRNQLTEDQFRILLVNSVEEPEGE